jgi:hypothetical protein
MSAAVASRTAADGHRAIILAALVATYMQAVTISLPNAALLYVQGTLSMADDEVGWIFTSYITAAQAAFVRTIGQFKVMMIAMLIVSSLVLFVRKPRPANQQGPRAWQAPICFVIQGLLSTMDLVRSRLSGLAR